ncbi:MAG TPA: hypothetical protein VGM78_04885 [Ilumatobacteraceae bacterium]
MLAIIFHYWLGLILLFAGGLVAVLLVLGYLKTVTAMKYPNGRRRRED